MLLSNGMNLSYPIRQMEHHVRPFGKSVHGKESREGGLETHLRWLEVHEQTFKVPPEVFGVVRAYLEQTGYPDEITPREVGTLHASTNRMAQKFGFLTQHAVEICMNHLGYERQDIQVSGIGVPRRREYSFVKSK